MTKYVQQHGLCEFKKMSVEETRILSIVCTGFYALRIRFHVRGWRLGGSESRRHIYFKSFSFTWHAGEKPPVVGGGRFENHSLVDFSTAARAPTWESTLLAGGFLSLRSRIDDEILTLIVKKTIKLKWHSFLFYSKKAHNNNVNIVFGVFNLSQNKYGLVWM